MPTEDTRILFKKLKELELSLEECGIHYGVRNFIIADVKELVIDGRNKAAIIRRLLGADLLVLHQFEEMLSDDNLTENN